jgi:ankyrin repeat protein
MYVYPHSKPLINIHSQNGWTPLMRASFDGRVDIVRLLVEAKAQINIQTEEV